MYLGSSIYRIHGTNAPSTIGKFVSNGCIRLTNEDVQDLASRVAIGTRVVVLPKIVAKNAPTQATAIQATAIKPVLSWAVEPIPVNSSMPQRSSQTVKLSGLY